MSYSVSSRLQSMLASPIRGLMPFALAAKKRGVTVYHLNIGDPDTETPIVFRKVLRLWKTKTIAYAHSQGTAEFLEALKIYYHGLGHTFIDTSNLQVTSGGSEAISMAIFAVTEPGDEILVFEPYYANYNTYALVHGVGLIPIRTAIKDGFHLPARSVIESAITSRTRAILYCSPNNPTGTVYWREEIEMLVDIAKRHGLFLLSDEVYREYTYDGLTQTSLLSYMKDMPRAAVVLDSLSKRYSLCGARLGVLVTLNTDIIDGVLKMAQSRLSSGFVDQAMGAKINSVPVNYFKNIAGEFTRRRNVLYNGLSKILGVVVPNPEGAFYIIAKLPVADATDFCTWLLTDFSDRKETVMLAPAAGFYASAGLGRDEVRIAYVLNVSKLGRCVELLAMALEQYAKR